MATPAPNSRCLICGVQHQYEVVERTYQGEALRIYGPTKWRMLPHTCPSEEIVTSWRPTLQSKITET